MSEEVVKELQAKLDQKDQHIGTLTERIQELGAFQSEALNARETIRRLESTVDELRHEVARATRQASDHAASNRAADAQLAAVSADVEKARHLAAALKHFIG